MELVILISFYLLGLCFFITIFFCLTLSEAPPINAFPANHAHILNSSENCFSLAPFCLLLITQFPKTLRIYQFSRYRVRGYFIPSFFHLGQLNYNGAKTMNKGGITERWWYWGGGVWWKGAQQKNIMAFAFIIAPWHSINI